MTPRTWTITVEWDPYLTSDNELRRYHWSRRSKMMRRAREAAQFAWLLAGKPVAAFPVRVSILCRRGRQMDSSNIVGGAKPLLDGLFVRALTPDDGPKWVTLGEVRQETGKQFQGQETVTFTITEEPPY